MGRIKTKWTKNLAEQLIKRHPDRFTTDFTNNKRVLDGLNLIEDKKIRNKIAGYIVRVVRKSS